jgi:E3 ubiquitin-protein ligase UBR4
MITPKVISLQEIKLAQTKTKITDMVAVRHPLSSEDYRTTLIILCEDGSLRMFLAAKEQTGDLIFSLYKLLYMNILIYKLNYY